jgi:hypothetical protein
MANTVQILCSLRQLNKPTNGGNSLAATPTTGSSITVTKTPIAVRISDIMTISLEATATNRMSTRA